MHLTALQLYFDLIAVVRTYAESRGFSGLLNPPMEAVQGRVWLSRRNTPRQRGDAVILVRPLVIHHPCQVRKWRTRDGCLHGHRSALCWLFYRLRTRLLYRLPDRRVCGGCHRLRI